MSRPETAEDASICIGCGFCCDGTLHDHTDVSPEDEATVRAVGLALTTDSEKTVFRQPCPKFGCGQCSIYDERPTVCRKYRCKLRKDVDEGRLSATDARLKIAGVKDLIARIQTVDDASVTPLQRKALWRKLKNEAEGCDEQGRQWRARVMLDIGTLDYLLDRQFRERKRDDRESAP
jgi:Fe-S-cluster containining protein